MMDSVIRQMQTQFVGSTAVLYRKRRSEVGPVLGYPVTPHALNFVSARLPPRPTCRSRPRSTILRRPWLASKFNCDARQAVVTIPACDYVTFVRRRKVG